MRGFSVLLLVACWCACITESDAQNALDNYCAYSAGKACTKTTDCCPGFACAGELCLPFHQGLCIWPDDAGQRQAAGEGCGCTNDCVSGTCTDSTCR